MSEWLHKYIATRTISNERVTVTAGLHHLDGNERPHFSFTCDIHEKLGGRRWRRRP